MLVEKFAPIVIERKNVVETEYLKNMSNESICKTILEIEELYKKIEKEREVVIEKLEKCIKLVLETGKEVNFLIGLKRKIYKGKFPVLESQNRLKKDFPDSYQHCKVFFYDIEKVTFLEAELKKVIDESLYVARTNLQDAYSNVYLNNAIRFINENIPEFKDKYKGMNIEKIKSHDRKKEATLLKIFLRGATKTSPFSTFTSTSFIAEDKSIIRDDSQDEKVIASINITYIMKIFYAIYNNPEVQVKVPFCLNPSIDKVDDIFAYSRLESSTSNQVFQTQSSLCQIKESPLLNYLYKNLKNQKFVFKDIKRLIPNISPDVYAKLIDIMFIIPGVKIPVVNEQITTNLLAFMSEYQLQEINVIKDVYKILLTVQDYIDTYNKTDIDKEQEKNSIYSKIGNCFERIFKLIDLNGYDPRNIIYEDFVGQPVVKELNHHQATFSILADISILFDENIRIQNLIADRFIKRYGLHNLPSSSKDMINLIVETNSNYNYLWDNEWDITNVDIESTLNNTLDMLKKEFVLLVKDEINNGSISTNKILSITNRIPKEIRERIASYDFFVQRNQNGEYILNNIYKGFLSYFSRFIDYSVNFESNKIKEYKSFIFKNKGSYVAEILEFQGFNANVHKILSDYRFITKGSYDLENLYGAVDKLEFADLSYIYDEKEKRIKLTDGKEKYLAMFLGNLMPMNLPGIFGLINPLFTSFKMDYSIHKFLFNNHEDKNIIKIPEVKIENAIIQRKGLIIKKHILLDIIEDDDDDTTKIKKLILKMYELEIPTRFFIQGFFGKSFSEAITSIEDTDLGKTKPVFIDMNNALILKHFNKLLPNTDYFLIEYENPNLSSTDYVSEHLIELSRKGI